MPNAARTWMIYAAAVAAAAAAVAVRWAAVPWVGVTAPYPVVFVVSILAAFYLGIGPGLLAIAVGIVGTEWWLRAWQLQAMDWARVMLFWLLVLIVGLIGRSFRRTEKALREQEALYRTLFNVIPAGVALVDVNMNVLMFNDQAARQLGYTREEFTRLGVKDVEAIESPAEVYQRMARVARTGRDAFETRHRMKSGEVRDVGVLVQHLRLDGSDRFLVLLQDITDRKKIERDLKASEERFRIALENAPVTVFTADRELRYTWVYHPDAYFDHCLLGKHDHECYPPEDVRELDGLKREVLEQARGIRRQVAATINGRRRVFDMSVEPLRDARNEVAGVIGASVDITGTKENEEKMKSQAEALQEADQRKNDFMAMLAHELRNPLAPIRNAAALLKMPPAPDSRVQRQSDTIERQVASMARLLDDLMDVARITRGKVSLAMRPVRLRDVLAQAVEAMRPAIAERRHRFRLELPPDTVWVEGDVDRLVQVVSNLLANAAKYTDEGGEIRLSGSEEDGRAVIRVRDNGVGIAPDMLARIFNLYEQFAGAKERAQGGLGIGLTLVRNLVEMHHGTVVARSGGAGQGSEFIVRLPVAG